MEIFLLLAFIAIVVIGVAAWASRGQTLQQSNRSYYNNDPIYVDPGPSVMDVATGVAIGMVVDAAFDAGNNFDPTDISDAPSDDFGGFDNGSFDGGGFDSGSFDGGGSDGGGGGD